MRGEQVLREQRTLTVGVQCGRDRVGEPRDGGSSIPTCERLAGRRGAGGGSGRRGRAGLGQPEGQERRKSACGQGSRVQLPHSWRVKT